jgi:hypothetical protein
MKKLLLTLTAIASLTLASYADNASNPSFHDGHWFHIAKNGEYCHATPDAISIQDGYWFHESPLPGDMHSFTRDRYGNYIQFWIAFNIQNYSLYDVKVLIQWH